MKFCEQSFTIYFTCIRADMGYFGLVDLLNRSWKDNCQVK